MSGLTSQPSLNAIVESLRFTPRETGVDPAALIEMSRYWEEVRELYAPFESGPRSPSAELYDLEMPGGQYTNLFQQAKALGLASRWHEVCKAYTEVNLLFGDIIKVTPTSKVVGDMALFLVANNLTPDDMLDPERELAFPESVVEFFEGRLGQPPGGFPAGAPGAGAQGPARAHRTARARTCRRPTSPLRARRPSALLGRPAAERDALSYLLYPRVFPDLAAHERTYSDTSILPTSIFFFGPDPGAEHLVEIEPGKTLIVKLLAVGEPHADGKRTVFFELNGQPREVEVVDRSLASSVRETPKADPTDPNQIGSPLPGLVVGVARRRRRRRPQGPEAALDRGHEDGDDALRRAPGPRRRGARRRRPPGQDRRAALEAQPGDVIVFFEILRYSHEISPQEEEARARPGDRAPR